MRENPAIRRWTPSNADLTLVERAFTAVESRRYLARLAAPGAIDWRQEHLQLFGRRVAVPRLTAWYGDPGRSYRYSGLTMTALPWTRVLRQIKRRVEALSAATFNTVLLNLYRDGSDSVAWHSDDEPELGREPLIASVSLGATRRFQLRHKAFRENALPLEELELADGSLLLMRGRTQHFWQHRVPKVRGRGCGRRINLTFRRVL